MAIEIRSRRNYRLVEGIVLDVDGNCEHISSNYGNEKILKDKTMLLLLSKCVCEYVCPTKTYHCPTR